VKSFPPIDIRIYSTVTSTNEVAKEILTQDGGDGTMIVADHQTEGRGRRGRDWFSPPSLGLWATLILRPRLAGKELFTLGLAAAVAICRTVEELYRANPSIQWPNDLYIDDRKFGGILVEIVKDGSRGEYALLGMGINLNQERDDFPPDLREAAVSLGEALGRGISRESFLGELNKRLSNEIQVLYGQGFEGIKDSYCKRSNLLQSWVTVRLEGGDVVGRVVDFGPHGELMLSVDGGIIRNYTHGEVHKVWR
jgi:BirA family biotin operon repressor/biotin-[acetyl-CoA-carboxylase] ligase